MYVKSLTLKGFKSFASATHMRLEPGITCIVGPNGSGKSNVVDALAWVMGEQGAKSLRGGKMEDVIFAGTAGRAPLGRAEVTMTIDNTDGALPIDYTEVTISRTMFRNGGSEYAINGTSCRLLDIQELLSDSGIGREMHVIVGQGQLDAVLRATPEERRGFIEEAAGVLKHRKRKEKAIRKLEGMEANLSRVADLTTEIRRQLGPLGRQAETARKAAVIQADARDARHRLLADDLVRMTSALQQEVADEEAMLERRKTLEQAVLAARTRITEHEEAGAAAAAELVAAQQRATRLATLTDRLAATASLAAERVRLLGQDEEVETTSGRDPDALREQAARARADEETLRADIARVGEELAAAVAARESAEQAHAAEQQRVAALAQRAADRREGLARLAGQVGARRSRIEAREAEVGRLEEIVSTALARADEAEREFTRLEGTIADEEGSEEGLDEAYERTAAAHDSAAQEGEQIVEAGRTADRDRQSAQARLEALELSLRRKDGVEALREAASGEHEIIGSVAELVTVRGGTRRPSPRRWTRPAMRSRSAASRRRPAPSSSCAPMTPVGRRSSSAQRHALRTGAAGPPCRTAPSGRSTCSRPPTTSAPQSSRSSSGSPSSRTRPPRWPSSSGSARSPPSPRRVTSTDRASCGAGPAPHRACSSCRPPSTRPAPASTTRPGAARSRPLP